MFPGQTVIRIVLLALLLAGVLALVGWVTPAGAQDTSALKRPSRTQAASASVELKQGMTPPEVQKLLGKPWRTALSGSDSAAETPPRGTLRWTYTWGGSTSSSSERMLNVDFNARAAGEWTVSGWNWSAY